MNVFHYVGYPLSWAPGGHEFQIRNTISGLKTLGVDSFWLRNDEPFCFESADIMHYWDYPSMLHMKLAKRLGMKIVMSVMLGPAANSGYIQQLLRKGIAKYLPILMGKGLYSSISHAKYEIADAVLVLSKVEQEYLTRVWGVPREKIHVVPNGLDNVFFDKSISPRKFDGMVCVGYICDVKNSIELAVAAKKSKIPIKFIGKVRVEDRDYEEKFLDLVDNEYVIWTGEVQSRLELAEHIKGARGLILASKYEAFGLVVTEALSLNIPVMVSDLKNLRAIFGDRVKYCSQPSQKTFIKELQEFYKYGNEIKNVDDLVLSWQEVSNKIKNIYDSIKQG